VSKPKRGLGRGLGALIPTEANPQTPSGPRPSDVFFGDTGPSTKSGAGESPNSVSDDAAAAPAQHPAEQSTNLVPVPGASFAHIDPYSVVPNPRQPRTVFDEEALAELVGSIREIGVLQPIVVRTHPDGDGFELIMGERRLRAAKEAGLTEIPAIIRETDDIDLLRDALVENLHRSQLNPLEEAAAYRQLLDDFDITHEQLAERISRSRPQISNTLRLLKLPPPVQRRVAAGVLSAGHARALLGLESPEAMEQLATRIVAEGLSVRATEESVTLGVDVKPKKTGSVRSGGHTAALDDLSGRIGDHLDTRVKIQLGRAHGKITIDFATVEDLNRIVTLIDPTDPGVFK